MRGRQGGGLHARRAWSWGCAIAPGALAIATFGCSGATSQDEPLPVLGGDVGEEESAGDVAVPGEGGFSFDASDATTDAAADTATSDATLEDGAIEDSTLEDGAIEDGAIDTAPEDTGAFDTGPEDTGPEDTGPADTGPADTGPEDTGPADTGPEDTGPEDTGPDDTGPADSIAPDTAIEDSAPPDTTPADTAPPDTGAPDTWTPPDAPTLTVELPIANAKIKYNKTSDACQGQTFRIQVSAPGGLKSVQLKFFTPDASTATTAMLGTCNGLPAYGYFADAAKYFGATSITFEEDVAIAGLYAGPAGSGRWWWCTPPGTGSTSFVESAPAPGAPGVQTLSNYCAAKGVPPDGDLASRWRVEITAVDLYGKTAVTSAYFWIHQ